MLHFEHPQSCSQGYGSDASEVGGAGPWVPGSELCLRLGLAALQVSYPSQNSSYPEPALHMSNGRNSGEPMETSDATGVLSHELLHCLLHTPVIGKLQGQAQHE